MTEIHGTNDDRFAAVRDAFAKNFAEFDEVGASVAVTLGGTPVVDLWAGDAIAATDERPATPWERDTIVNVYSTTKTMAATSVLVCVDRGLLDFDAPVADYWPEFAANGKGGVTVAHVMSHSTGLAGFEPAITPTDLYDWDAVVTQLAGQAPWWEPGTATGYHAVTQGYLQGELVRRVTGRSIGTFFREEIAGPLGADFHIGLPASEDGRVAELIPPAMTAASDLPDEVPERFQDNLALRTLRSVALDGTEPRTRAWRAAEIPAAGGTGNARSVARIHSAIACGGEVDGVRLLSQATIDRTLQPFIGGVDQVLGAEMNYGMGFGLQSSVMPLPNERTMFWGGWGGSIAVIDTENQLTVAYVMNRMAEDLLGDRRGAELVTAAYISLLMG